MSESFLVRLRETLIRCDPFENDKALKRLFIDERIGRWRDGLPEADNVQSRVERLIYYLYTRPHGSGEQALVLFLRVVGEGVKVESQDHKDLKELAAALTADPGLLLGFKPQGVDDAYRAPPLPEPGMLSKPGPLPPGSHLPHEWNPMFTGREKELKELARLLLYEPEGGDVVVTQTAVASGLGGIGKTQLAVAFGHCYGRYFPGGVYWLNMERTENVPAEIALLGGVGGMRLHPAFERVSENRWQPVS